MKKYLLLFVLVVLFSSFGISLQRPASFATTRDDVIKATLNILEQNGYENAKFNEQGFVSAEKNQEGVNLLLAISIYPNPTSPKELIVGTRGTLPDMKEYSPEQKSLGIKTQKEQVSLIDSLVKKRIKYFNSLQKYVSSHYGLTPETIEVMKTQELTAGLSLDQASFILQEKYYRYESSQAVSAILTGLANVLNAAAGGSGNRYQQAEFDNDVHCKTSIVTDENNPGNKITVAYYYYRDPKSNQSFWLNGHYVDVKNYNASAGETPIYKLYFEKNKLIKWEDLQELVIK